MDDILIHTILGRMDAFRDLNMHDEPIWIYKHEYNGDTNALQLSLQYILDEELAYGFEMLDYEQNKGLQLDIRNVVVTDSGKKIRAMSTFQVRAKSFLNKTVGKFRQMQENMDATTDKYENYSDERLLTMVRSNNFSKASNKMVVLNILKQRGYTLEDIKNK